MKLMAGNPDLVIRGGSIADGLGGELFEADVAITDERIVEVGRVLSKGKEEIDACGKLVTPGFVDLHTHYDGQVTWSQDVTPSSQNGVTTAIMGNCGVGFAPCRRSDHQRLIQLMEGVEDPRAGPERGIAVGVGEFSGLHGLAVATQLRHGHRRATAARRAARLRDGRTRRAPRSRHAGG
jgi:hypothetical protein